MSAPVMVTGASGLLGANLVMALQAANHPVIAVSKNHPVHGKNITTCQADLAHEPQKILNQYRPKWIIHCAALTDLDYCEAHPEQALRINAHMPGALAAAAHKIDARMIYISTDSVFDGHSGHYRETDTPAPVNHYAMSKWRGEQEVRAASDRHVIARVNIFGWNAQAKKNLAEWILDQYRTQKPFPGFQDVLFNPLLVNDLADRLIRLMGANAHGVFHLASRDDCSKFAFAKMIGEAFGFDVSLVQPADSDAANFKTKRPKNTTLNTDKIIQSGITMPTIREGIARFQNLETEVAELRSLLQIRK